MMVMMATALPVNADATDASTTRYSPITITKSQGLRSDSELGQRLLSQARRVEDNNNNNNNNAGGGGLDMTWVADYAIKFQGCHFVQQFGENDGGGNNNSNNLVEMKSFVRFRLCPDNKCNDNRDGGCSKSYGEYIIGLDTFVDVYYKHRRQKEEYECELYLQEYCYQCVNNNNNQGDDFNAEQCQYDCLTKAGNGLETMCMNYNPYEADSNGQDNQNGGFEVERYMECAEYELKQNNNNNNNNDNNRRRRRHLEGDAGSGLFIGPYCAEQGGGIYLGMFTDDTCTTFADTNGGADTFAGLEGVALPYATESIVTQQCLSCLNTGQYGQGDNNNNNNNNNGNYDANYQVAEVCQEFYQLAGKCEQRLPSGTVGYPDNNACSYISGVQSVREDGMIGTASKSEAGASVAFIVVLCVVIVAMALYVHYLRTKIARRDKRINDPKQPMYPEEEMFCG